jgi:flagellar hook-basal body complex protein FliE
MNTIAPTQMTAAKIASNPLLESTSMVNKKSDKSFSNVLENAINDVDTSTKVADRKLEMLASGEDVDIHGTMIALQEADISIRTMSAFRDKITDAYKNLINMAI